MLVPTASPIRRAGFVLAAATVTLLALTGPASSIHSDNGGGGYSGVPQPSGCNYVNDGPGGHEMNGGPGCDEFRGNGGWDKLYGQRGSDGLHGGTERDKLYGHDGLDVLNGGQDGTGDYLNGGGGNYDRCHFHPGESEGVELCEYYL